MALAALLFTNMEALGRPSFSQQHQDQTNNNQSDKAIFSQRGNQIRQIRRYISDERNIREQNIDDDGQSQQEKAYLDDFL